MQTILDAILIFDFFQTIHDAVFELTWSDEPEKDIKDNKRMSFLLHIHVLCRFLHYFPPFDSHFEFLNILKCSMMPRWHHSDSSSERYQEVKSIKTFYAAHISRSQAKSMFGNWTNTTVLKINLRIFLQNMFLPTVTIDFCLLYCPALMSF